MDDHDKIDLILTWAEGKDFFDPSFVEHLQERLERFGTLSDKQRESLDFIIDKFEID